ncbi:CAP domain-containing protein [Clostridium sp.]|uniref:CAP domain-containing protein n=1 Tax=Clostridium sp. TaxID=1506 RepID=UPI001DB97D63|nr:CAP domain-containing protein [Clostridium sp.]MBS5987815.1 hypothetical protein [Clostridium sp.]
MSKIVRMIKNMSKVQKIVALAVSTVVICGAVVGGVLWYSYYSEKSQMKVEAEQIIADAEKMDSEELSEFLDNNAVDEETRKTLEEKLDEKYAKEDETVVTKPSEDKKEETKPSEEKKEEYSNGNGNNNSNSSNKPPKPITPEKPNKPQQPSKPDPQPQEPQKPTNPPVEKPQRTWKYMDSMSNELFILINDYRQQNGLHALKYDAGIQAKAKARAELNASREGSGHDNLQISITTGRDDTPREFLQRWIDSPNHNSNLLEDLFTRGGVAIYKDSNDIYYIVAGLDMDF